MLFSYLNRHYKIIVLFFIFVVIFALVFSLYHLEVEAVLYAGGLCLLVGIIAFFLGFTKHLKKHRTLDELMYKIELGIDGLPTPNGVIESDYQKIIQKLYVQNLHIISETDGAKRDMLDYYTLWAHQIKTPIAALRLLISEKKEENKLLEVELFKVEQYVNMVLQYIRLGSDTNDLLLKTCDLDSIIRGCLRKYARLFVLKHLEFSFEETHLKVLTDEKWIAFVIEQLFSNSLKYTTKGKISIYSEGQSLIIEDTGIGIRPEDLPLICEKGYTGAGGRSDKKSTGIGLFLCKSVLNKLGHEMKITSKVGLGTTVKIDLHRDETIFE